MRMVYRTVDMSVLKFVMDFVTEIRQQRVRCVLFWKQKRCGGYESFMLKRSGMSCIELGVSEIKRER